MKSIQFLILLLLALPTFSPAKKITWKGILFCTQTQEPLKDMMVFVEETEIPWENGGMGYAPDRLISKSTTNAHGKFSVQIDPEVAHYQIRVMLPGDFEVYFYPKELWGETGTQIALPDTLKIRLEKDQFWDAANAKSELEAQFRPFFESYPLEFRSDEKGSLQPRGFGWEALNNIAAFLKAFPSAKLFANRNPKVSDEEWQALLGFLEKELKSRGIGSDQFQGLNEPSLYLDFRVHQMNAFRQPPLRLDFLIGIKSPE